MHVHLWATLSCISNIHSFPLSCYSNLVNLGREMLSPRCLSCNQGWALRHRLANVVRAGGCWKPQAGFRPPSWKVLCSCSQTHPSLIQHCLPFQIHSGDIEHNTFQPEDHKETLREGAVANAFPIDSSLKGRERTRVLNQHVHIAKEYTPSEELTKAMTQPNSKGSCPILLSSSSCLCRAMLGTR